ILAGLMILAACCPAFSQQTKILTAEKHNEYGLIYTLPVTALEVEVTAVREVRTAGPYYRYAKKYTGSDNVVKENSESWTIKSVSVRPYGIPNPDQRYLMQLKSGALTYIGVDADNMLLSINHEPSAQKASTPLPKPQIEGEKLADNEYLQYVDEDFIASQSSAKQAQMLAENLMEIRDAKVSLTRGTADNMPSDGKQLELMLNSLAHQEKALTAAFLGNITRETVVRRFSYVPVENARNVLFRLSDFEGFVAPDDYSGEPVYINVHITDEGALPVDAKGEEKKLPKDAVAYCVPGAAKFTISYMGRDLFSAEYEVAQFGVNFGLNPAIFTDKKSPSYAVFDPATGALKEIGVMKEGGE
ncbi:MAG: DUF4831 family protein, partial [Muribaculaceae bacterium]|nr:DUF4831 family protein [Muribaculaceae bacterium]